MVRKPTTTTPAEYVKLQVWGIRYDLTEPMKCRNNLIVPVGDYPHGDDINSVFPESYPDLKVGATPEGYIEIRQIYFDRADYDAIEQVTRVRY